MCISHHGPYPVCFRNPRTRNDSPAWVLTHNLKWRGKCLSASLFLSKGLVSCLVPWGQAEGWERGRNPTETGPLWLHSNSVWPRPQGGQGLYDLEFFATPAHILEPYSGMGCVVCACVSRPVRLLSAGAGVFAPLPDQRREESKSSWVSESSMDVAKRMQGLKGLSKRKEGSQRSDPLSTGYQRSVGATDVSVDASEGGRYPRSEGSLPRPPCHGTIGPLVLTCYPGEGTGVWGGWGLVSSFCHAAKWWLKTEMEIMVK